MKLDDPVTGFWVGHHLDSDHEPLIVGQRKSGARETIGTVQEMERLLKSYRNEQGELVQRSASAAA